MNDNRKAFERYAYGRVIPWYERAFEAASEGLRMLAGVGFAIFLVAWGFTVFVIVYSIVSIGLRNHI